MKIWLFSWILDIPYWILSFWLLRWILDIPCWILDIEFSAVQLDIGYSVLDIEFSAVQLDIGYSPAMRDPAWRDGLLDIHDFVPLGAPVVWLAL